MQIIAGTTQFHIEHETAVAIGKFDGIHVGHRRLLQEILDQKQHGRSACVFTFDPPPSRFFGKNAEKELTTREEKRRLFEELGVDILVEFPLNGETAATSPEDFVTEILHNRLHAAFVAAGVDLSFGAKGAGNAALLKSMASALSMEVKIIDKITLDGVEVSSTLVRSAVEQGQMQYVESLLGNPYSVRGIVQHGNRIGRSLFMPTVNLIPEEDKLLPKPGVYFSAVVLDGHTYKAISNVGLKPTVKEDKKVIGVESYLYDFDGDAYDKEIDVLFFEFRREEKKFENLEALKAQLAEDKAAGAGYRR